MPEARLLTIDETLDADIFWYEERYNDSFSEYGRAHCGRTKSYVVITRIGRDLIHEDRRDYGSGWRCWSWKPTELQRRNAMWTD